MFVSLMFICNEIAVDCLFIHLRSSLITLVFSITYNRWYVYTSMLHYPSLFSWIFRLKWQREIGTLSPPQTGDRALSPLGWATGSCRPLGGATGSLPPILNPGHHSPPFPLSFEPKNSEKKRGWGEEKRRSSAELRTTDLQVTFVWIHWYCITI